MVQSDTAPAAPPAKLGLAMPRVQYRSQGIAYPFFVASAILFLLQILLAAVTAAQYVWPTFLMDSFAFNMGRETHLNLLIFWLLLGLMGAAYYLIPEETGSEIWSVALAYVQLAVLLLAGVATLGSFWFLGLTQGRPFTESPMPLPWLIALGIVLFLVNIGVTIFRSHRGTAIALVLLMGMTLLAGVYAVNMISFANLTVEYYWWWWIIHLWVEGAWELIAAAVMAYLLIKLTGVDRGRLSRWLYLQVSLVLFTGIVGIGHHYYWIGTPSFWLLWGAIFSALETVPIALMAYDALRNMKERRVEPANRVAWYWLAGSAIGHLIGAGAWGFAQTLPQINQWTHGTQITAAHGHFAFFGAFATLVLGAVYTMLPSLKGMGRIGERRGLWAFWLMLIGMVGMVASLTFGGVVQTYLFRMLDMEYIQVRDNYVRFWLTWRWIFGLGVFLPGVSVYVWDFFAMRGTKLAATSASGGTPE